MKTRLVTPCLLGLVLLVGCSGRSDMPSAGELLAGAHASLEQDDLDTASIWLASAGAHAESEPDRRAYALLSAELALRHGEPEVALAEIEPQLEAAPDDPRVHELAGKARLLLGAFPEASAHFDFAMNRYVDEPDVQRASDLRALSHGLEAYARGDLEVAREHWAEIRDERLLTGVLDASDAMDASDGQDIVARSIEPAR